MVFFAGIWSSNGFKVLYKYNRLGLLTAVDVIGGDGVQPQRLLQIQYDLMGRVTKKSYHFGGYTNYHYNENTGTLKSLSNILANGSTISEFFMQYDRRGRIVMVRASEGTWKYKYDARGQLSAWEQADGDSVDIKYDSRRHRIAMKTNRNSLSYAVNKLGQCTSCGNESYTWSANGNLEIRSKNGMSNKYDANNRLISSGM